MITYSDSHGVWEMYGKSTDTKPTHEKIHNGSLFYEMDTGKIFMFDGEDKTWLEQ